MKSRINLIWMVGSLVIGAALLLRSLQSFAGGSDYSCDLIGGYSIYRNSAHSISVSQVSWGEGRPRIPEKVIEVNHDGRFIIAKRQGLKFRDSTSPYEIPDNLKFDYWILDTVAAKLFGPLELNEFEKKKMEFGVKADLKLIEVGRYKNENGA